jgi:peptidoglycan/xylan/chitin deacetylase (PgdA/CDA1 family)
VMRQVTKRALRVPILTYHSIDRSGSLISTSPEKFREQMQFLKDADFNVIPLADLVSSLREVSPLPAKSVAITFDDGLRSVYQEAFPVLQDFGFAATVFLVAEYCGRRNDWNGQLPSIPIMDVSSWDEIQEMSRGGVEFGAHTQSHPDLAALSHENAVREVLGSKATIEDYLGREVRFFAYPCGNRSQAVDTLVRKEFAAACSTELAFVNSASDVFFLPRIDMYYFSRNQLFNRLERPSVSQYLKFRRLLRFVRARIS